MEPSGKIGEGTLGAYARLGLAELRNAAHFAESNIVHSDPGMWGSATQKEVNEARSSDDPDRDTHQWETDGGSILKERLDRAQTAREDPGREAPSREPEQPDRN